MRLSHLTPQKTALLNAFEVIHTPFWPMGDLNPLNRNEKRAISICWGVYPEWPQLVEPMDLRQARF